MRINTSNSMLFHFLKKRDKMSLIWTVGSSVHTAYWWLAEVRYWFKVDVWSKMLGTFSILGEKMKHMRSDWTKYWQSQTNLKFRFGWRGTLVVIFDLLSYCWLSWMLGITKNHKNSCHGSIIKIEICNEITIEN